MIRFACACGRSFQCQDDYAGRQLTCPSCQQPVLVPGAPPTAPLPPPAMPIGVAVEPIYGPAPAPPSATPPRRPEPAPRRSREEDEAQRLPGREAEEERKRPVSLARRTSGKAIAAMILGLVSLVLCGVGVLPALVAIIFGLIALVEVRKSDNGLTGAGMAFTGLITAAIALVLWPTLITFGVIKIFDVRDRELTENDLRRIGSAMTSYNSRNDGLPPDAIRSKDGQPLLSWRVALLPSLSTWPEDSAGLYRQFRLDEPWDSPHNKRLVARMPRVYARPGKSDDPSGLTYYRVFVGPGTAFEPVRNEARQPPPLFPALRDGLRQRGQRLYRDFPDGTSNTILVVEAAEAVPWTKPDELTYSSEGALPKLGGHRRFGSGYVVLLADGSVRTLSKKVSERTLRAAITRNGGEVLGADW